MTPLDRSLTLDPIFGLPPPPIDARYDPIHVRYATVGVLVLTAIVVALALRDSIRARSSLPMLVTLSGVFCVVSEPFIDVVGAVFYPLSDANHAFTILGRQISWLVVAGWSALGSVSSYLAYAVLSRRPTTRAMWGAFLAMGAFDLVLEETCLNIPGLYGYYGHQPLVLLRHLPWWFIPCNAGGMFLAIALAHRFRHSLQGWRGLSLFLLNPMCVAGMYGFIGMPAFIVVNGNFSWWTTQLAGLLSLALGFFAVALTIRVVLERDPLNLVPGSRSALAPSGPR